MTRSHISPFFMAVLLGAVTGSPAIAQTRATTGDLVVIVVDESAAVAPGVSISVSNDETGLGREGTTDGRGRLLVPALPPGEYSVRAGLAGFAPAVVSKVALSLGTTTDLTITLRPATFAAQVAVVAPAPLLDLQQTAVATTVGQSQIATLPIDRRSYIAFALLAPGVASDRTLQLGPSESSGLTFAGQSARANNVTVDGLDNNDDAVGSVRAVSQDAVREFQVLAGSYTAEFGNASGGVVNIVTRSGTNRVAGSVFEYFRDRSLNSRGHFDDFDAAGRRIDAPKAPLRQHQFGATLGGPLKKNRTFGFLSVERLAIDRSNIVTIDEAAAGVLRRAGFPVETGSVPFGVRSTMLLGKIDHAVTGANAVSLRINSDVGTHGSIQPFGGIVARSRGGERRNRDYALAGSLASVVGSGTVNELRAQASYRSVVLRSLDPACAGPCVGENQGGPAVEVVGVASVGRTGLLPQDRVAVRYQVLDTVSRQLETHHFKTGVDLNVIDVRTATFPLAYGGQFVFADVPPPLAAAFGLPGPASAIEALALGLPVAYLKGYGQSASPHRASHVSGFAQDEWRARPPLTLHFGLRYQKVFWPEGPYRAVGIAAPFELSSSNTQFAPRVGLAWDPVGDGRTALKASYGVFFDDEFLVPVFIPRVVNGEQTRVVLAMGPAAVAAWRSPGRTLPTSTLDALPSLTIAVSPRFDTPYTHQSSIGLMRQFDRQVSVSVSGVFVKGSRYPGVIDYNPTLPDLGPGRRPLDINGVAGSSGSASQYASWGETWYRGFLVSVDKRMSGRSHATLAYTLSKAEDTVADFALNPAQYQGRGRNPADPNGLPLGFDPRSERGPSLQDQRHRLVVSGQYLLPGRLDLSGIFTVGSGRPFNIVAGADLNGDGDLAVSPGPDRARTVPADPSSSIGRNAGLYPVESRIDLRISKRVPLPGRAELTGTLDVLNVLNQTNYIDVNRVFGRGAYPRDPLPTFGQFTQAAAPRQVQLGARVAF